MSYQGEPDLKTPSQLAQFHSTGGAIQATAEEKSTPSYKRGEACMAQYNTGLMSNICLQVPPSQYEYSGNQLPSG